MALGLGWVIARGEDSPLGLGLLLAEPLLWMGLALAFLRALTRRRWLVATASASGLMAVAVGLRTHAAPIAVDLGLEGPTPTLRSCASHASAPAGPLRLVSWNTEGALVDAMPALLELDAQIYVLQELDWQALAELEHQAITRAPEQDTGSLFVPAVGDVGSGVLVTDGWFGVCGAEQTEIWVQELPAQGDRSALSALSFPTVEGVGMLPLITFHADRPRGLGEALDWPGTLAGTSAQLARTAAALEEPGVVVVGDSNSHGTFRNYRARMRGGGLAWVGGGASWPARLGPLPALPIYQVDRAWAGAGWRVARVQTLRLSGSAHLALVVDLIPSGVAG